MSPYGLLHIIDMTKNQKLGDFVCTKTAGDVEGTLNEMENLFLTVRDWINANNARDSQRVILQNLLTSSAQYLRVAADNLSTHISVLALATRSLYELNVRTRAILCLDGQIEKWQSEAITDKIQTYEGLLLLQTSTEMNAERVILHTEITRLDSLRVKYGLPIVKKPSDAGGLAPAVGLENEHKGLFKLFSKLVHPSSYLTNDYTNAASTQVRLILQLHTQIYAWDTFARICDAQSVPDTKRSFPVGVIGRT